MADVRSLLRSERASRRIEHPLASYSRSGALSCTACNLAIKAESLWDLHIKSAPHIRNVKLGGAAQQAPAPASTPQPTKRKRGADSDDEDDEEQRKRTKAEEKTPRPEPIQPPVNGDASNGVSGAHAEIQTPKRSPPGPVPVKQAEPRAPPPPAAAVDEDEWAAFERDMATPPPAPMDALKSNTIEAAPVTAEELARQAREEQSKQKGRREEELEAEKEEAVRNLEQEFDEMEQLEDRVRKLREKRELLKRREQVEAAKEEAESTSKPAEVAEEEVGEESDDESDYDDDWNFGRS